MVITGNDLYKNYYIIDCETVKEVKLVNMFMGDLNKEFHFCEIRGTNVYRYTEKELCQVYQSHVDANYELANNLHIYYMRWIQGATNYYDFVIRVETFIDNYATHENYQEYKGLIPGLNAVFQMLQLKDDANVL